MPAKITGYTVDTRSKLPATFVPFSALSLIRPRTIKVASTTCLSLPLLTWEKIPGSYSKHWHHSHDEMDQAFLLHFCIL